MLVVPLQSREWLEGKEGAVALELCDGYPADSIARCGERCGSAADHSLSCSISW